MRIETKPGILPRRILLLFTSILLAALFLFLFLPRNAGAFRAVPAQTSLLLECTGLLRAKILTDKTPDAPWREVLHSTLFEHCFEDADAAFKLFGHDPNVLRAFAKNKALAAFSLHPADSLHALFALELDADFELEKSLKTNKLSPKYFPHQFHGNDIFNVHLSKTEQIEVTISGRILLFSRRATLLEDALAQLENPHNWWADRPHISDLPESPLRIHIRPSSLAAQWRGQMNAHWRELPDLLARNVEWLGLSWDGKSLKALAETNGFLRNLSSWGQTPGNLIYSLLPDNTAFLVRAGLGNVAGFFRTIGEERSSDFEQYVEPWVGTEAAIAVTEPLSPELKGDRLLLLAVRDSSMAIKKLQAFGKAHGTLPGTTGAYQMFEVLSFQSSSLLKPLLGDDEAFRNPVCALVGGFAVFAPDRSSLEIFLDKYLVNQTLSANVDFLQLQQKHAQNGLASFMLNTAYLPSLLQNLCGTKGEASFAKTGFIGAELQPGFGRKMELTLTSQAISQPLAETDILWKSVFAAPVATQPYLVEQAANKTFVLIQDLENNLHCLDAQNGANDWNRALPNRILSEISGIDFYGNGAKCYTFSTATQLYTLNEKGHDVDGFPFKLSAKATNGATVVEFDQNTKFNYFVACENGKIYGFGPQGKPLDGWNGLTIPAFESKTAKKPAADKGKVRQPMLHFQYKGKDYLAVLTEGGLLSVFGRDGALRFEPVQLDNANGAGEFNTPLQVDAASNAPHIYCGNSRGSIFACDLMGQVSTMQVGKPGSVAAFGQLSGDARFEWAVLEGKNLTVGGWGKLGAFQTFKTQFPEKQHLVFITNAHQIGTVNKQGRRVWLLDNKGNTVPGFPLGGNTAFEFCRLNEVDMLVSGNVNGVWAYRVRQ